MSRDGAMRNRVAIYCLIKLGAVASSSQVFNFAYPSSVPGLMSPAFMRLDDFQRGEPSTSLLSHEPNTMHVQYPRSNDGGSGVQANTIIFIVVGVVCLFVILAGFYLVSRHAKRKAATSATSPHTQHSPIIHPPSPRRKLDKNEYWKVWKTWRQASRPAPPILVEAPSTVSPTPISPPSPMVLVRAFTHPPIAPRPGQERRVTSLSVTTSFSHSHITQEALNDFRVSAYDLDGDLETEMLNSARDDVWPGLPLAVVEYCGELGVQESMEARGDAAHFHAIDGSAHSYVPLILGAQEKGSDYENTDTCQITVSCVNDAEGNTPEGGKEQ